MKTFLYQQEKNEMNIENLSESILEDNLFRGRLLAVFYIVGECLILGIYIAFYYLGRQSNFPYMTYFTVIVVMIASNLLFLFYQNKFSKQSSKNEAETVRRKIFFSVYLIFIMSWSAAISLMDVQMNGDITVYLIYLVIFSSLYITNSKSFLLPYGLSVLILAAGLPFSQLSQDFLFKQYLYLFAFSLICFIVSRLNYSAYHRSFQSRLEAEQSNRMLETQIAQNMIINEKLSEANAMLKRLSHLDELTEIPNRRSFREEVDAIITKSKKELLFSAIMIDIDFFKQYNDNYGHNEGDIVLREVAKQIDSCMNHRTDFLARWGGEEFVYAAFHTDEEEIIKVAETIRGKILSLNIEHAYSNIGTCLTASFGTCTQWISTLSDVEKCIEFADRALYSAKTGGRNQVKRYNTSYEHNYLF